MKNIIILALPAILFFVSCTSNDSKSKSDITPIPLTKESYNPQSVCDCSTDGIQNLTKILKLREKFSTIESYNKDIKSVQDISTLSDNFIIIRNACLMKFASTLLNPSECNNPYKIRELREKLTSLGVKTN